MAPFRLLDLPSELRDNIYRCFFDQKLIQVVSKPCPESGYREIHHDSLNLFLLCKQTYPAIKSSCVTNAIFILDLHYSDKPFLIAKTNGLRNVMIERGFIQLFPPQPPLRDMLPPFRQSRMYSDQLQSWDDIEEWRTSLERCIVRFDLYRFVPGKGYRMLDDDINVPFNYIPRIAEAWNIGLGRNMTIEFYGMDFKRQKPTVIVDCDRQVSIHARCNNSVEEDCLVRKILCLLDVDETQRLKCGIWDENPTRRYAYR